MTSPEPKPARKRATKPEVASEVMDAASPRRAITPLNPLEQIRGGLAKLAAASKVFDLTTAEGDKEARAFRAQCVSTRTSVVKAYEKVNRPLLDLQKEARGLVATITAEVMKIEQPVDAAIQAKEAEAKKKADDRRAAMEAERAALRQKIQATFALPRAPAGVRLAAVLLREARAAMEGRPVDEETFGDLTVEAHEVKTLALESLSMMIAEAERYESEQAELAKQREEIAAQKKKDAEERAEREKAEAAAKAERDAKEAAERKQRDEADAAERAKQKEADDKRRSELAADEKRLADARAQLAKEQAAADERQRQREASEKAEREAKEAEARRQREEAETQAQRQRDAEAAARTLLQEAAPAMHAILTGWRAAELAEDEAAVEVLRRDRDRILSDLRSPSGQSATT